MDRDRYVYCFLDIGSVRSGEISSEGKIGCTAGISVCDDEGNNVELFCGRTDDAGEDGGDILRELSDMVSESEFIIVWSREMYRRIQTMLTETDITVPKNRVIILRELAGILSVDGREPEFRELLSWAGIDFTERRLEDPGYRVICLEKVFFLLQDRYREAAGDDRKCILNISGRTLHHEQCRCLGQTDPANVIRGDRMLIFRAYKPCKCCRGLSAWGKLKWTAERLYTVSEKKGDRQPGNMERIYQGKRLTDRRISGICEKFGMKYTISQGVVFIRTQVFSWRVYHDGQNVTEVLHENYRGGAIPGRGGKCNEGFHRQRIYSRDFYQVIRYIYRHDRNYLNTYKQKGEVHKYVIPESNEKVHFAREYRNDPSKHLTGQVKEGCFYMKAAI